jgi:hypothetical protein
MGNDAGCHSGFATEYSNAFVNLRNPILNNKATEFMWCIELVLINVRCEKKLKEEQFHVYFYHTVHGIFPPLN